MLSSLNSEIVRLSVDPQERFGRSPGSSGPALRTSSAMVKGFPPGRRGMRGSSGSVLVGRPAALVRVGGAAGHDDDPIGDAIEEVAVVRDRDHRPVVALQRALE